MANGSGLRGQDMGIVSDLGDSSVSVTDTMSLLLLQHGCNKAMYMSVLRVNRIVELAIKSGVMCLTAAPLHPAWDQEGMAKALWDQFDS